MSTTDETASKVQKMQDEWTTDLSGSFAGIGRSGTRDELIRRNGGLRPDEGDQLTPQSGDDSKNPPVAPPVNKKAH